MFISKSLGKQGLEVPLSHLILWGLPSGPPSHLGSSRTVPGPPGILTVPPGSWFVLLMHSTVFPKFLVVFQILKEELQDILRYRQRFYFYFFKFYLF